MEGNNMNDDNRQLEEYSAKLVDEGRKLSSDVVRGLLKAFVDAKTPDERKQCSDQFEEITRLKITLEIHEGKEVIAIKADPPKPKPHVNVGVIGGGNPALLVSLAGLLAAPTPSPVVIFEEKPKISELINGVARMEAEKRAMEKAVHRPKDEPFYIRALKKRKKQ